jgi:hypothetical protein
MFRKFVFLAVSLAFIFALPAAAGERVPVKRDIEKKMDANHDGFLDGRELARLHEFEKAYAGIEELRKRAEEEKNAGNLENAKRLWQEAEESKRRLMEAFAAAPEKDAPPRGKDARPKPEGDDAELGALLEKAERCEAEGRREDAEAVRGRVMELLKKKFEEAESRIREAREKSAEAKKRGDENAAREWWEAADKLEAELKERAARLQKGYGKRDEDRDKPRGGDDRGGMEEKIRSMIAKAEELERNGRQDEAAELRKKAERLIAELKGQKEPRDEKGMGKGDEGRGGMEEKIRSMIAKAEELERNGRQDEAAELRKQAKRMTAGEPGRKEPRGGDGEIADVKARIEKLRGAAAEMKKRGDAEKSAAYVAEADELERSLKREMERRQYAGKIEDIHARMEDIRGRIEDAKREGREDEAKKLAEELRALELAAMKHKTAARISELEEQTRMLRERAARLKEKGAVDEMNAMLEKAEALEREIAELKGGKERKDAGISDDGRELREAVDQLREEVKRLRAEIERLKKGGREEKPPRW